MSELAALHGSTDRLYVVERGVRDQCATLAFVEGQCHGLALALHRRKGWPLVAIDNADGDCVHVCVRDPDGRLVDIRGFHLAGTIPIGNGHHIREVNEAYVAGLTERGWSAPDRDAAEAWVDGVLARSRAATEPMPPPFGDTRWVDDGYQLRLLWDGRINVETSVRVLKRSQEWVPYIQVPVPRDRDSGRRIIDFTQAKFDEFCDVIASNFDRAKADSKLDEYLGPA
jgi:hypothetical protein